MSSYYFKERAEKQHKFEFDRYFGEGNYDETSKRFNIKNQVLNDDEIIIITRNIQYFPKKQSYVLWVDKDKVVYLKRFQLKTVYNYEEIGDCYLVKLNRNYFKVYDCFVNEKMVFDKEDTFDSLAAVAKEQTGNGLWFKEASIF